MQKRKVEFLPAAQTALMELFEHIAQDDITAAISMVNRIEARVQLLSQLPYVGERLSAAEYPGLELSFRKLSVHPYHVYYHVTEDRVQIGYIVHERQNARRVLTGIDDFADEDDED